MTTRLPADPAPGWYTAVHDRGRWRRLMRPMRMVRSCGHETTGAYPADMPLLKVGDEISCWSSCVGFHCERVRRVTAVEYPAPLPYWLPADDCAPDCAERAACDQAGTVGHMQCGMCPEHGQPVHHCAHPASRFLTGA